MVMIKSHKCISPHKQAASIKLKWATNVKFMRLTPKIPLSMSSPRSGCISAAGANRCHSRKCSWFYHGAFQKHPTLLHGEYVPGLVLTEAASSCKMEQPVQTADRVLLLKTEKKTQTIYYSATVEAQKTMKSGEWTQSEQVNKQKTILSFWNTRDGVWSHVEDNKTASGMWC